jgi:hypothetical protein
LKALVISRFFEFVKWPANTTNDLNQFTIGIIGDSPILEHRVILDEKIKIPGKQVKIKYFNELDRIEACQALIISGTESYRLHEILNITGDKPILSIGDTWGFGEKGVLINLYETGTQIKFEINLPAVKRSGLTFSSKLYKLARIIK